MELVIVERSYPEPVDIRDVAAQEKAVAWCLEQHRVHYKYTYFARSRRHMICYYEAPDAEAVRATQDTGGLAYDHIWAGQRYEAPEPTPRPRDHELIVVQRALPRELALDASGVMPPDDCLAQHRVVLRHSHRSTRGDRMVCCMQAPDADAVRSAALRGTLPLERAWPATLFPA